MQNFIGLSIGRYRILEQLGEGGMAIVYRAFDTRLESDVAFKVIRKEYLRSENADRLTKRFEREAKALAKLNHTNIVKVIDYGEFEGSPYLIMPYLPNGTLRQKMGRPVAYAEAARLLIPIARALEFAHEQGMIHRDVKPSNILVTESDDLVLTDFGIAKILEADESVQLTGTGLGLGTPEYMAPEQWIGKSCQASDQYALGVVFYELVTGRKPYEADTPAAVLLKQANDPLPRPRQFVSGISEEAEKVILKCLAKTPENRYPSMNDFAQAMEELVLKRSRNRAKEKQHHGVMLRSDVARTVDILGSVEQLKQIKINKQYWRWVLLVVSLMILGGFIWGSNSWIPYFPTPLTDTPTNIPTHAQQNTPINNLPYSTSVYATPAAESQIAITSTLSKEISHTPTVQMTAITISPSPSPMPSITLKPTPLGGGSGKILFVTDRDGNHEIYVMDTDGLNQTRLTNSIADEYSPRWSPDGKQIAFSVFSEGYSSGSEVTELYVMNADGSNKIHLTDSCIRDSFQWSPDGKQIAFFDDNDLDDSSIELYVMNADGSKQVKIRLGKVNTGLFYTYLEWSPDGKWIAFAAPNDLLTNMEIYRTDADGSNQINLTNNPFHDFEPRWSPDGKRIAFISQRNGGDHIFFMDADGSNLTTLPYNFSDIWDVQWSQDGKRIALRSKNGRLIMSYIVNTEDLTHKILSDYEGADTLGPWSPDGKEIIVGLYVVGREPYAWVDGWEYSKWQMSDSKSWSWSPNGKEIVFTMHQSRQIYTINSDGLHQRRLTGDDNSSSWDPQWSP